MYLYELLDIRPGLTALIGGGGKTTLMHRLADELSRRGTVIVCTSTKILIPEAMPVIPGKSAEEIFAALNSSRVICVGTGIGNGKLSAPAIPFDKLKELADYVLVEADGAHRLPVKAHAPYEPVIPACADRTILVIGADAFGNPIADICHRPEIFASRADVEIQSAVTPEAVARVIAEEGLGDILYINKTESEERAAYARSLSALLNIPVVAGSLKEEEYQCLR
jgi:probable selenium-dependent hydroxylase accessory protein YqeC